MNLRNQDEMNKEQKLGKAIMDCKTMLETRGGDQEVLYVDVCVDNVDLHISVSLGNHKAPKNEMHNMCQFDIKNGVLINYVGHNENVVIPDEVRIIADGAFYDCHFIKTIKLHNQIQYIGERAFAYCTSLEAIDIPDNINTIKDLTFYNCSSLKKVGRLNDLKSIGCSAFKNCYLLGDSDEDYNRVILTADTIGDSAFENCNSITALTLRKALYLGKGAFKNCKSLINIVMGANCEIEVLPAECFYGCNELLTVYIYSDITKIDYDAFAGAPKLRKVVLPQTIEIIDAGAFRDSQFLNKGVTCRKLSDSVIYRSNCFYGIN